MTRLAELGVQLAEALRAEDALAAAQALADAHESGGRQAVGAVLVAACAWGIRTGRPDDGQAEAAS